MSFDPEAATEQFLAGVVVPEPNGQWGTGTLIGNSNSEPAEDLDPDAHLLGLRPVGVIAAEVDAMGEPAFLFEPVWPYDAYGMVGAAFKAGKTWMVLDAAVSVASGTPWLDTFPTGDPGPVTVFLGEGGKRKMTRRGRAVAAARGVEWDDLPIVLAERVPRLRDDAHITALRAELERHPARLVIIDPLYLAAAGANSGSVYDMGAVLEPVQLACQDAGSALMVVHHHNRDTGRSGADRMSGAGPAEWGRVLMSAEIVTSVLDRESGRTDVTLKLSFSGDEIPGGDHLIKRTVWADDPNDLGAELNYRVTRLDDPTEVAGRWDGPTHCMESVEAVFDQLGAGVELTTRQLFEHVRARGTSFRDQTIRDAAGALVVREMLALRNGRRNSVLYRWVGAKTSTEPTAEP